MWPKLYLQLACALLTVANALLAAPEVKIAAEAAVLASCADMEACVPSEKPICALNKKSVCFKHFSSECHMNYKACTQNTEYIVYHPSYCELTGFMCKAEYNEYMKNILEHENIDDTVYSIYRKPPEEGLAETFAL